MKTIKYTLFGMLLLLGTVMQAQGNHAFPNVDEMHARKWQFMIDQAKLNPQEAAKVQSVFIAYEKSIWQLHERNRANFKNALKVSDNEKPNYTLLNDMYINQEIKKVMLLKSYHQKLRRILAPESLFNYYRAERSFKRKLLHNMPGRPHADGGH